MRLPLYTLISNYIHKLLS